MPSAPRDDPANRRLVLDVDGGVALADYVIDGDVITFTHTFVPEAARGRGVATRLVEAGLALARDRGLKVVPQCPTFAAYLQSHPGTRDLLVGS